MIRRMLDILVCPFDKKSTLELYDVVKKEMTSSVDRIKSNLIYNNSKLNQINSLGSYESMSYENIKKETPKNESDPLFTNNLKNDNDDIVEGFLYCIDCKRFYPIVEEIPIMLPDELRDKEKDLALLKKWSKVIPEKITKYGVPWHL